MKRRNVDINKLRRPLKRNTKISEGFPSSFMVYCKLFGLWFFIVLIDYMLDYRFEYLWAFYLVLRSLHDTVKYQGVWFSLFFVSIVLTSDLICFFFIPVAWLLVIASTSVWIQCVWCLEKSLCWTNFLLWSLFLYFEIAIRFRNPRYWPYHIDLCRPFSANSIGYPVVHLGFGVKSYVCYKLRLRRQREVAKENQFYMQLLQQALISNDQHTNDSSVSSVSVETIHINNSLQPPNNHCNHHSELVTHTTNLSQSHLLKHVRNGHVGNGVLTSNGSITKHHNNHHQQTSPTFLSISLSPSSSLLSNHNSQKKHKDFVNNSSQTHDDCSSSSSLTSFEQSSRSPMTINNKKRDRRIDSQIQATTMTETQTEHISYQTVQRLETDIRRLKSDLQLARNQESDLQSQLNSLHSTEKSLRVEISNLQKSRDDFSSRLNSANSAKQSLQNEFSTIEKKFAEEKKSRANAEQQLNAERKARKQEEHQRQRELAQQQQLQQQHSRGDCTEHCRKKRYQLDNDLKEFQIKLKWAEDRYTKAEQEVKSLAKQQNETEFVILALSKVQDRNKQLENSLSSETRVKLELFSALGEAKRQLEIRENLIENQRREIDELKSKITQVLAVMPSDSFTNPSSSLSLSRMRLAAENSLSLLQQPPSQQTQQSPQSQQSQSKSNSPSSNLDPNALAYTPKSSLITTGES